MRHVPALIAAASATVVCTLAQAQVLITENYDDGLAASRWTFTARENNIDPAVTTPDSTVNFAFNYGGVTYESNTGTTGTGSTPPGNPTPIPASPGGGGTIGVQIHVNDGGAPTNITQGAIMPSSVSVGSNYILKTDMFLNYNAPSAGSGSTESYIIGLNADGAGVVGDDLNGGAFAANKSANGYAFSGSSDGDNSGDYRVFTRRLSNTDGTRYSDLGGLINTSWTGTSRQPFIQADGKYAGTLILPDEANGGAGNGGTIPYRGFNQTNTYYRDEVFPNSSGYEVAGVAGKHWVQVQVEQHGKIALYLVNGKVINHVFLPSELSGKPSLGLIDGTAGQPDNPTDSYVLFDNTSIESLTASAANTIPGGATYVTFNGGGTQTADGAATVNGITMDTTPTTLAGTGTLTLGSPTGAIWSGNGAQVISKPLSIQSDSAIYVDAATDSLTINSLTTGPNIDLHKVGKGTLIMPAGFEVKSFTLTHNSKVKLTGAGGTKIGILSLESQVGPTTALPFSANLATLDLGRAMIASDYSSAAPTVVDGLTPSPLPIYTNMLINGAAFDTGTGDPAWTGTGFITSDPELQGHAFYTSAYTIRFSEASDLGYTDGASWMGKTIDATTALIGFTYRADFNLDQTINFNDLVVLAQNYNTMPAGAVQFSWKKGDANGDGTVDFNDLVLLAQNYNQTITGAGSLIAGNGLVTDSGFASDWILAQQMVPEPTSLALLGLGASAMIRRRR